MKKELKRIDHCDRCRAENSPVEEDKCPQCGAEGYIVTTWGEAQAERYRTRERYDPHSKLGQRDLNGEVPEEDD